MDIQIGGIVSFTTIDFPGKLAAVLFLVGCPLKCVYCSNSHLIAPGDGPYDPDKVFDWLRSRVGKLEAVVFSGGEALMQGAATIDFMRRVRELGFAIGLHTNGFYPNLLAECTDIVDWVGMDFKATREKYNMLTGRDAAYDLMIKSLDAWVATGRGLEVRTTCDPRFVDKADLLEIAKTAAAHGAPHFAVQKYTPYETDTGGETTPADRAQFFTDDALRRQIDSMFETVTWRE